MFLSTTLLRIDAAGLWVGGSNPAPKSWENGRRHREGRCSGPHFLSGNICILVKFRHYFKVLAILMAGSICFWGISASRVISQLLWTSWTMPSGSLGNNREGVTMWDTIHCEVMWIVSIHMSKLRGDEGASPVLWAGPTSQPLKHWDAWPRFFNFLSFDNSGL